MTSGTLWNLTATTRPEAGDAASELMLQCFGVAASTYEDARTGRTQVTVCLPRAPREEDPAMKSLRRGLRDLRGYGLVQTTPRLQWRRLRHRDWAESWKRHFQPMEIGGTLLLRPSWSRIRARRGLKEITLDPGLSFGTGNHPTTRFCLEELVRLRPAKAGTSAMLDVGTGSGILAIAAARLGYAPIEAFDFDPDCVRVSLANAGRNRVARHIRFLRRDLSGRTRRVGPRRYPVICANLTHDLLVSCREALVDWLQEGGSLILAGILTKQFAAVAAAYESAGMRLVRSRREKEWRSGSFVWQTR